MDLHGRLGIQQPYDLSPTFLARARSRRARIVRLTADLANLDLPGLDHAIRWCRFRGIKVLVCVAYNPQELGDYHGAPKDLDEWARRVGLLAARWRGKVTAWEVWNEPNHGPFWVRPNPLVYSVLLDKTYRAIKAADPKTLVVTGGTSPRSTVPGEGYAPVEWLERIYECVRAMGIPVPFDAIGHHGYSYPWAASTLADWNAFQQSATLRAISEAFGDPKPVWCTEVGFPVGAGEKYVTEAGQALLLEDLIRSWRAWPWAGPLIWFLCSDLIDTVQVGDDPAGRAGLYRQDGTLRPAGSKFRELALAT